MGGNLLQLKRKIKSEYLQIKSQILEILTNTGAFERLAVPYETPDKLDFGDVDILAIINPSTFSSFDPSIHFQIQSKNVVSSSTMLSFEFMDFQIDLIFTNNSDFDTCLLFYSFADFGMIMGIICRQFGLKFSSSGLYSIQTLHVNREFFLSNQPQLILEFLGLSHARWSSGFQTEKHLFEFIKSSRFYRSGTPISNTLRSDERKSKANRFMFTRFLESVECDLKDYDGPVAISEDIVKQTREEALVFFGKEDEYHDLEREVERQKIIKAKFNGKLVGMWTGLNGKDLGDFMAHVKTKISSDDFLKLSIDQIQSEVVDIWKADRSK